MRDRDVLGRAGVEYEKRDWLTVWVVGDGSPEGMTMMVFVWLTVSTWNKM